MNERGKRAVDVVVTGPSASGLTAASSLARSVVSVCVVEASRRWGGWVHTVRDDSWPGPIELGAELLHGRVGNVAALLRAIGRSSFGWVAWAHVEKCTIVHRGGGDLRGARGHCARGARGG